MKSLDSRFRGNDKYGAKRTFYETIKIGIFIPTNDMHSDITTLENQLKVMRDYRKLLCGELKAAICICNQLNEKDRAKALGVVNERSKPVQFPG